MKEGGELLMVNEREGDRGGETARQRDRWSEREIDAASSTSGMPRTLQSRLPRDQLEEGDGLVARLAPQWPPTS